MKFRLHIVAALSVMFTVVVGGCKSIDDMRLPSAPVNIVFQSLGMWEKYGVTGAMQYRTFIKSERIPYDYPYSVSSYTGYGGVLLVSDYFGTPIAYDLSCPVECKPNVRVIVTGENVAECPVCHSTYGIFEGLGRPLSGIAYDRGYGLTRYVVAPTGAGGYQIYN